MIRSSAALENIREAWATVEAASDRIRLGLMAGFVSMPPPSAFADIAYSLSLVYACSVLEEVLRQFCEEERFFCESRNLGPLMKGAKDSISWLDYALIEEARLKRNDIAHRRVWIDRDECWKYLDAIRRQLKEWDIVGSP